jgi:hypothetical protein
MHSVRARDALRSSPHLETRGKATQLIVDGKPFLMRAGELHNSSSSSLGYMKAVWPPLSALHLNTVRVPVAWEGIQATEDAFDFQLGDGLLNGARDSNLKTRHVAICARSNPQRREYRAPVPVQRARSGCLHRSVRQAHATSTRSRWRKAYGPRGHYLIGGRGGGCAGWRDVPADLGG